MKSWLSYIALFLVTVPLSGINVKDEVKWIPQSSSVFILADSGLLSNPELKAVSAAFSTNPKKPFPDFTNLEKQLGFSFKDWDQITMAAVVPPAGASPLGVMVLRFKSPVEKWLLPLTKALRIQPSTLEGQRVWVTSTGMCLFQEGIYLVLFQKEHAKEIFSKKPAGYSPLAQVPYGDQNFCLHFQVPKELGILLPKTLKTTKTLNLTLSLTKTLNLKGEWNLGNQELALALKEILDGSGSIIAGVSRLFIILADNEDIPPGLVDKKIQEVARAILSSKIVFSTQAKAGTLSVQAIFQWSDIAASVKQLFVSAGPMDLQTALDEIIILPSPEVRLELEKKGGWKSLAEKRRSLQTQMDALTGKDDPESLTKSDQVFQQIMELEGEIAKYRKHLYPEEQEGLNKALYGE